MRYDVFAEDDLVAKTHMSLHGVTPALICVVLIVALICHLVEKREEILSQLSLNLELLQGL